MGASLRFAPGRPLTASFPGKIGTHREDGHVSGWSMWARCVQGYPVKMSSELSPGEIRAAAEAHRELGPEYSDAVVESFLERVDRRMAERVDREVAAPGRHAC